MKEIVLRAKLRKWHDRDLEGAVRRLNLEKGEMSDLVREGFRIMLAKRGVTEDDLHCLERKGEDETTECR